MPKRPKSSFEEISETTRDSGLIGEFWAFLKTNKKWWLTPVLIMFLLLGLLVLLTSSGLAPFIYTLF